MHLHASVGALLGLRTDEALHTRAIAINSNSELLDADQSWDLVNATKVQGSDWLSVINEISPHQVELAFDKCDVQMQTDYEIAKCDRDNENSDRVNLQLRTTERHKDRLLATQRDLLQRYRQDGRERLIPMTEGRIRAIERKFALRLEHLRQQGEMTPRTSDVCYGVIRIVE